MAAEMTKEQHDELAVTYAALLLHDAGVAITADKLSNVIAASNNKVEPYWPGMFAKLLEGADVADLLQRASSTGSGAAAGGAAAGGDAAPAEEAKEEEEEEEEEVEMGGLFGDDSDDDW
eukprot:PLAT8845.1.p1 GENE.PLAT8845.1~~PLAT8845.1.p1  ORF type:complete len:119 (+),score=77.39 PLAT8845.1:64-420(+)